MLIFISLFFGGVTNLFGQQSLPPGVDSVVVTFKTPPVVIVQKAPLKYNKAFAMSFQMDDALSDIFEKVYPVFHGNGITPGLTYTDGCGNPVTFKMSSGVYIFSSNNNSDILDPDDPYHDQSKLTWPQLDTLYKSHWGIENHGLFDNPDVSSPEKIEYAFQRTESYARRKISDSIIFKSFIIPNGVEIYASYLSKNHYHAAINQGKDSKWIGYGKIGFDVESDTINWLKSTKLNRWFLYRDFKSSADSLYQASKKGVHKWLLSGMHDLPGPFIKELKEIYDTYGEPGLDDILLAPDDEILDYLAVKQATQLHETIRGNRLTITFSGSIPSDRMYYALSLNVFAHQPIEGIQVFGGKKYSFRGVGKDTALINLSWDGRYYYPTEILADSFTDLAMTTGSEWKALVAMDYVEKLPPGEKKIRLQDSLCSLDQSGWTAGYDAGFCNLVHLGPDTTICPGENLVLSGPENMAVYNWYRNGKAFSTTSAVTVFPDSATAYALLVKDKSGNEMGDTINVSVFHVPKIQLGVDTSLCAGSNVSLKTPSGNYTYHWSTGDTISSITISPVSDTMVAVTVHTTEGCQVSDSINITYSLPPVITIPQDSSTHCFGDSVFLTATAEGSGISYQWDTGDSTDTIVVKPLTPDTTFTYSVKATSAEGCTTTDTAHIFVLPEVAVKMDTNNYETCNGRPVTISSSAVQGDFTSYIWTFDGKSSVTETNSYIIPAPGTSNWIQVVATDRSGCSATDSTYLNTIDYPQIIIPGDTGVCSGDSLHLSGRGGPLFYWLYGADTLSKDSVLNVRPSQATTYYAISGFDTLCMRSDSLTVSLIPLPKTRIVRDNTPVCMNTPLMLTATGADRYLWMPGNVPGDTFSIKPADTLVVYLIGTSKEGCVAKDSLTLSPAALPQTHFSGLMPSYCENDPVVTLTGEPEGGIFSGDGMSGAVFSPELAGPGNHTVFYSYTSSTGCVGKFGKETFVYGPVPAISIRPPDTTLQPGGFVRYDAGPGFDAYYWTTGDVTRKIRVNYDDYPPGTDTIRVVGVTGGCSSVDSAYITFGISTGITNNHVEPLTMYPNPAHTAVAVSFRGDGKPFAIEIFDVLGKRIYVDQHTGCSGNCSVKLDVSHLKPGIYYVWLYNEAKSYFSKMVVQ